MPGADKRIPYQRAGADSIYRAQSSHPYDEIYQWTGHQQQIPRPRSSSLQLRICFLQLGSQNLADSVLDEAHLADDVTFRNVDLGIGALGGMGLPYVIHVGGIIVVEPGRGCSSPELGQVVHAQLGIFLVYLAILCQKIFGRR